MRLIFLFVFFSLKLLSAFAQNGYSITYQSVEDSLVPIAINGEKRMLPRIVERLVFYDSLSICYRILPYMKDPLKKANIFGQKVIPNAILYNSSTNLWYSEFEWHKGNRDYLIKEKLKIENWQFLSQTKEVLGYKCRSALLVNEKNDSTLVWFTDLIPKPFGPNTFFGFPGVVLEVFQQPWNTHLRAVKIELGNFQVVMPRKGIIISDEEFRKLKK